MDALESRGDKRTPSSLGELLRLSLFLACVAVAIVAVLDWHFGILSGPSARYAARWDQADGSTRAAALVLHRGGSFAFVRTSWVRGRKFETLVTYCAIGTYTNVPGGRALRPTHEWLHHGPDTIHARFRPIPGSPHVEFQYDASVLEIESSALSGQHATLRLRRDGQPARRRRR